MAFDTTRTPRVFVPGWLQLRVSTKTAASRVARASLAAIMAAILATVPGYGTPLPAQTGFAPIQPSEQSASIHGVVLNANTNQPVARALVQVGRQAILTGHDGKFDFANLAATSVAIKATKPGFYDGLDPYRATTTLAQVGSPGEIELRLYPEALVTGTLTAANGDPLPQIVVQALLRIDNESGSRWMLGGQTITKDDGQFRLPLPGGEYVIETLFSQERTGARHAVLPVISPASGSNVGPGGEPATMHLMSGSEQHLELHPPTRPTHTVHIQVDGIPPSPFAGRNTPQIQAHLANGLVFSPVARPTDRSGEIVVDLPVGSYVVSASITGREEAASYGETKVTVADADISGIAIHLQQATEMTVEAAVDPAANSPAQNQGENSLERQVGVYLQKTDTGANLGSENISPTRHDGGPLSFSLLPGRYRLRTSSYSPWFIESATAGGTDLLTNDLVVDGGSSSLPLRLVVSNQTATVKGTVKRVADETAKLAAAPFMGYVYLIAEAPSASPVIGTQTGQDGTFSRALLPPGSYRVLASEARLYFDPANPAVQRRFAPYMKTIAVAAGETGSVDLNAVPPSEWKP